MYEFVRKVDNFLYDSRFGFQNIMWWLEFHFGITPLRVLWLLAPIAFAAQGYVVLERYWEQGWSWLMIFELLFVVFLVWYLNHLYTITRLGEGARTMNFIRENPTDLMIRFLYIITASTNLLSLFSGVTANDVFMISFAVFLYVAGCSSLPPEKKAKTVRVHGSAA